MTIMNDRQLHTDAYNKNEDESIGRNNMNSQSNWLVSLAFMSLFILCLGLSLINAGVIEERVLPEIMQQLVEAGQKIKNTTVIETGTEPEIVVTLVNGEIRKYDDQGTLKEKVDANGKITLYKNGMPIKEVDSAGKIISQTKYIKKKGKVRQAIKTSLIGMETKLFDEKGLIIESTDAQGTKTYSHYVKNSKGKTVQYNESNLSTNKTETKILDPNTGELIGKIDDHGVRIDIEVKKNRAGEKIAMIERGSNGKVTTKKFKDGQLVEKTEAGVTTTFKNSVNNRGQLSKSVETKVVPTLGGSFKEVVIKEYDHAGRIARLIDKDGIHEYTYEVDVNGRVVARREKLRAAQDEPTKEIYQKYNDQGQVVLMVEDGKATNTEYVVNEKGKLLQAVEHISYEFGNQKVNDEITKVYDGRGLVISQTNSVGDRIEFEYDANGNQISIKKEHQVTSNEYDDNNNLISSITRDHKSTTYTNYNPKTKLATKKVRVTNSGVTESTIYGLGNNGERVAMTTSPFGFKTTVTINSKSDEPKRVQYVKNNGKIINTNYEYSGEHLLSSKEVGPEGITETIFNIYGKPVESGKIDQFERQYFTDYHYAGSKMVSSILNDKKGKTTTTFNKYEDPETIIRINVIGYPRKSIEKRTYKDGMLVESVSSDVKGKSIIYYDENEQAARVHRVNKHGFPRENWVSNTYDEGGDIKASKQIDTRGQSKNWFDQDGLMTKTVRIDSYGFPKLKTTIYGYKKGELSTSTTKDERGRTDNEFDKDGLMRKSVRTKIVGFPRAEITAYEYNSDAYMTYSFEKDENGKTENWYTIDEVVDLAYRKNKYGHARDQWTKYAYDSKGFMTWSIQRDLRGITINNYNKDSLAINSTRHDRFGVLYSRDTITKNNYDNKGFMTTSESKNLMGKTMKTYDKDSLVTETVQDDNFGIHGVRHKVTDHYEYDRHGKMQTSITQDRTGTTYSDYDIHGDAIKSKRDAVYGLLGTRHSFTESVFDSDTGMTLSTKTINQSSKGKQFSTTKINNYDPVFGVALTSKTINVYGLGYNKINETKNIPNLYNGQNRETYSISRGEDGTIQSRTRSWYKDATTGVAKANHIINTFGIGAARESWVREGNLVVNEFNGQNQYTKSESKAAITETWFKDETTGVAKESHTLATYGIGAAKESWIKAANMIVNEETGQNSYTKSESKAAITETWFKDKTTGVAKESHTISLFGIGAAKDSWIKEKNMVVNEKNGQNIYTKSVSEAVVSETWYKDKTSGVARQTHTLNRYGIGDAKDTWVKDGNLIVNEYTGLNQYSKAVNKASIVETWFKDKTSGVSKKSHTLNTYGIGAAQESWIKEGDLVINEYSGMTKYTKSKSKAAITETWFKDKTSGVAKESHTINTYGIGASLESWVKEGNMVVNEHTGQNIYTKSESKAAITETWFKDKTTGVAKESHTTNYFGIGAAKDTWVKEGDLIVNEDTGLNIYTKSVSEASTVESWFKDKTSGVTKQTHTINNFGIGAAKDTWVKESDLIVNEFTGLNSYSKSVNEAATTETWFKDGTTGVGKASHTVNTYGIGAAKDNWVREHNMEVNEYTGQNIYTKSVSQAGSTETWFKDETTGVAKESRTLNSYGIGAAKENRIQEANMVVNEHTGQNSYTKSVSKAGTTETWYKDETTGVARESHTINTYGIGASLDSWVKERDMVVNEHTGQNIYIKSVNEAAVTETWFKDKSTGVPKKSFTVNTYGLGAAIENTVKEGDLIVNEFTGLSQYTKSISEAATVETWYNDKTSGVANRSRAENNYGIGAARLVNTVIDSNEYTGLNKSTVATSIASVVKTNYKDESTGVATESETENKFGLGAAQFIKTMIETNEHTGLNQYTKSISLAEETETWYKDKTSGVSKKSHTIATYGLGAAKDSWIKEGDIIVNEHTGLNQYTKSVNKAAVTETWFKDQTTGVAKRSHTHATYGIGAAKDSWIHAGNMIVNEFTGLTSYTKSENEAAVTETWHKDESTGVPKESHTLNTFGIGASQDTWIREDNMIVNEFTGLNIYSKAENDAATVETWFRDNTSGVAKESHTINKYGIGAAKESWIKETNMIVNEFTGLNSYTKSESGAAIVETWFKDETTGVPKQSHTIGRFGIGASLESWIQPGNMQVNEHTGQNSYTKSVSAAGTTETWFKDKTSGVPKKSKTFSNFGIGAAQTTYVDESNMVVNEYTGLNIYTKSTNDASTVETWFNDTTNGVANSSHTINKFGIGAAKDLWIRPGNMLVDTYTGQNSYTKAVSNAATVETWFKNESTGVPKKSHTKSKYGLHGSRDTWTHEGNIQVNEYTGQTMYSKATNAISSNESWFDHGATGVLTKSKSHNYYGIRHSRVTEITEANLIVNKYTGQNQYTKAINASATVETWYKDRTTGVAKKSRTTSATGIGAAKISNTSEANMRINEYNGLNQYTKAISNAATVETWYNDTSTGVASSSKTENNYGTGASRVSNIYSGNMIVNETTGISIYSKSISAATTTENWYDANLGTATITKTKNNFGLTYAVTTMTTNYANEYTGLNRATVAVNGLSTTTSYYDEWHTGLITRSKTVNQYGVARKGNGGYTNATFVNDNYTGINKTSRAQTYVGGTLLSTVDTAYHARYGTAERTTTYNTKGARYASGTVTTNTVDHFTGMNTKTRAVNRMSTTATWFDPQYGVAKYSETSSNYGVYHSRKTDTLITAYVTTGLTKESYATSKLSETWAKFNAVTGTQTETTAHLFDQSSVLAGAAWSKTNYYYNNLGTIRQTNQSNRLGITITKYNSKGFTNWSENTAAFGLTMVTQTNITVNENTGMNKQTTENAYSRKNGQKVSSTTTKYHASLGIATWMKSVNTTGALNGRTTITDTVNSNANNGNKTYTYSHSGLNTTQSWFNKQGVVKKTITRNKYGPKGSRVNTTLTADYDRTSGMKKATYATNAMSKSWSYYDRNGLQTGGDKENYYGSAEGNYRESSEIVSIHFSGVPAITTSQSAISTSRVRQDEHGRMISTETANVYGGNGEQRTTTRNYKVDRHTGQVLSSITYKSNGDRTSNSFHPTYGYVTNSSSKTKDGTNNTRTTSVNHNTNQITGSHTTGDNNYSKWTNNDHHGRPVSATTSHDVKSGKKKKTKAWRSVYTVNKWTGLMEKEQQYNISRASNKTIVYDIHGVKRGENIAYNPNNYPKGQVKHVVAYNGRDANGNATSIQVTQGTMISETRTGLKWVHVGGELKPMHTNSVMTIHQSLYASSASVNYTLSDKGPIAATYQDTKGRETWIMDNSYEKSAMRKRTRVNSSGGTMTWDYGAGSPEQIHHTTATITYQDLDGIHNGTGTETYTQSGLLLSRVLKNKNSLDETITYENDGSYLTTASGVREDGVTTTYAFAGANDLVKSSDDKGLTTWDPSSHKRTSTHGGFGTFNYTYQGDRLDKIIGNSNKGRATYDGQWNIQNWVDTKGITHTYLPTAKTSKGFVTKANERFVDKNGTVWSGTMNYEQYGFYFSGGTLKAKNAKLDGQGADNTVTLDKLKALRFVKQLILAKEKTKETWTWGSGKKTTLGEKIVAKLNKSDITQKADVELNINSDGSTTAKFSNIRFKGSVFSKRSRYKPKASTSYSYATSDQKPGDIDKRNTNRINNVYYKGNCGYTKKVVGSSKVKTGTKTETYIDIDGVKKNRTVDVYSTRWKIKTVKWRKINDGWDWKYSGYKREDHYADTMMTETESITAGFSGSDLDEKNTSRRLAAAAAGNRAQGVSLGSAATAVIQKMTKTIDQYVDASAAGREAGETVGKAKVNNDKKIEIEDQQIDKVELAGVVSKHIKLAAKIAKDFEATKNVKKDNQGRIVAAVDKLGHHHSFEYERSGLTETIKQNNGAISVRHYNVEGQLLSENLSGKVKTYVYEKDQQDQISKITMNERSAEHNQTVQYDGAGRVMTIEANNTKLVYEYSNTGEQDFTVTEINEAGNQAGKKTYQAGRLTKKENADGSTNHYNYLTDGNGKIVAITQKNVEQDGKETTLKYDSAGRMISVLGADAARYEKMVLDSNTAEKNMVFELEKDLYSDPRMDGTKIDSNVLLNGIK